MICPICNLEDFDQKHPYLVHKIKYKDFIEKYFPRKDLLTGEIIPFKSLESYELTDFNSKNNLKKYLEFNSKEKGLNYLKDWLLRRKQIKNLIYAPGEFECKSLCFPSIKSINKLYGINNFIKICNDISLKLRYDYNILLNFKQNPYEIIIDTREIKPYNHLELPIKVQTLNFADYCPNPNPNNLFIERKEINDWAGVMSKSYERFNKELQRAKDNNSYIIILIESSYNNLLSINYLPQTKWIKASSDFLFKRARDLYLKFDNFQMVAGGTRLECINLFNKLIKLDNIKLLDIQWLISEDKL